MVKGNGIEMIKGPGIRIFTIPLDPKPKWDLFFYCEFCAKKFHFFYDHMDQVICGPTTVSQFEGMACFENHTPAIRCAACRAHGRTNTFNKRQIVDPTYGDMGDAESKVDTIPKRKVVGIHDWTD